MLNTMEALGVGDMGFNTADYLHASIEAKKLAWADRAAFYGDPNGVQNRIGEYELGEVWDALASKEYGRRQAARVDMERAATMVGEGTPMEHATAVKGGDTIYASFASEDGMMVSWIQSTYGYFGARIAAPGTGFPMQNRGSLFTLQPPNHPNVYEPGKRPFHTIIPAFATRDDKPWLAFGVMGGDYQSMGQVQVFLNQVRHSSPKRCYAERRRNRQHLDLSDIMSLASNRKLRTHSLRRLLSYCMQVEFDMNPQEAGDAPRWTHGGSQQPTGRHMDGSGTIGLESGICQSVREELESRGHDIRPVHKPYPCFTVTTKGRVDTLLAAPLHAPDRCSNCSNAYERAPLH